MNRYQPLPTILVATEGNTEKIFLDHLRERNMGCALHVIKSPRPRQDEVVKHCSALVGEMKLDLKKR